jgi:hypothetical protein
MKSPAPPKMTTPADLSLFIYGGSSFRNRLAIHFRGLTLIANESLALGHPELTRFGELIGFLRPIVLKKSVFVDIRPI